MVKQLVSALEKHTTRMIVTDTSFLEGNHSLTWSIYDTLLESCKSSAENLYPQIAAAEARLEQGEQAKPWKDRYRKDFSRKLTTLKEAYRLVRQVRLLCAQQHDRRERWRPTSPYDTMRAHDSVHAHAIHMYGDQHVSPMRTVFVFYSMLQEAWMQVRDDIDDDDGDGRSSNGWQMMTALYEPVIH